ncbi:hypothetical protein P4U97_07265 [Bacillus swezeyi]|uniref:hypothetical protein n=1 Tax=Bacillus swezeyi TaxID=1925020 RepID=UPI002E217CF4|nr:hypothetical protein [Bacillus swezeyi]
MKKNAPLREVFFHPDHEHSNDCIAEVQIPVEKKQVFHPLSRKRFKTNHDGIEYPSDNPGRNGAAGYSKELSILNIPSEDRTL